MQDKRNPQILGAVLETLLAAVAEHGIDGAANLIGVDIQGCMNRACERSLGLFPIFATFENEASALAAVAVMQAAESELQRNEPCGCCGLPVKRCRIVAAPFGNRICGFFTAQAVAQDVGHVLGMETAQV